ncbi:hypothetical protein DFP72DRAFT_847821 [Ephemerocybe angulata]|uniref:Uncharacterized protein n=1 Tax=Ephemerocybe angulata TaxID=980116 RepID=A0A8H6M5U4_9AGAR|nr:hypothetical protein DFP72DRAFT_849968 [Tulosesus angulatus]KAF6755266.1 hypothetical protein DFP72DRAFT_847821 [Tulosesus angulatus]
MYQKLPLFPTPELLLSSSSPLLFRLDTLPHSPSTRAMRVYPHPSPVRPSVRNTAKDGRALVAGKSVQNTLTRVWQRGVGTLAGDEQQSKREGEDGRRTEESTLVFRSRYFRCGPRYCWMLLNGTWQAPVISLTVLIAVDSVYTSVRPRTTPRETGWAYAPFLGDVARSEGKRGGEDGVSLGWSVGIYEDRVRALIWDVEVSRIGGDRLQAWTMVRVESRGVSWEVVSVMVVSS